MIRRLNIIMSFLEQLFGKKKPVQSTSTGSSSELTEKEPSCEDTFENKIKNKNTLYLYEFVASTPHGRAVHINYDSLSGAITVDNETYVPESYLKKAEDRAERSQRTKLEKEFTDQFNEYKALQEQVSVYFKDYSYLWNNEETVRAAAAELKPLTIEDLNIGDKVYIFYNLSHCGLTLDYLAQNIKASGKATVVAIRSNYTADGETRSVRLMPAHGVNYIDMDYNSAFVVFRTYKELELYCFKTYYELRAEALEKYVANIDNNILNAIMNFSVETANKGQNNE